MNELKGYMNGITLSGWLSDCVSYDKSHFETFVTEEDIKRIALSGKDHVRLPIDNDVIETEEGHPIMEGLSYIDKCLEWCRKYKLNVIIDLHKTQEYYREDNTPDYDRFFFDEELHRRFCQLWDRLVHRYAGYSDMLAFELLTRVIKPQYKEHWSRIATSAVKIIRFHQPDMTIMVGGHVVNPAEPLVYFEAPHKQVSYVG